MENRITWVGMDVHKKSINVAMLLPDRDVAIEWQQANEPQAVRRLAKRLVRESQGEVRVCYEAGPCGFGLQRKLEATAPLVCEVVAPSLIPRKPGDWIKTDRRDARKLAEFLRANLLTEVKPPTEEEEAIRDLCRCRESVKEDLLRARHRLSKFLLRRSTFSAAGGKAWTTRHRLWLRGLRFEHATDQVIFDEYLQAVEQREERLKGMDERLIIASKERAFAESVEYLRCFRGIETTTAMTVVAELHDFLRFRSPRQLMSFVGLVASEYSTGEHRVQGSITKAGNRHVRRVLVEAAWHYRHRPGVGAALRKRRQGQPAWVIRIADKAQQRLCRRYRSLTNRGKETNKAVVAVARELVGFIWAVLHEVKSRTDVRPRQQ